MKSKLRILNISEMLDLLTFMFFMKPGGFAYIPFLDAVFDYGRILFFAITVIRYYKNQQVSKYIMVIIIQQILLIIPTITNSGSYFSYAKNVGNILGMAMLIELIIIQKNIYRLEILGNYLLFLSIANIVSIILLPENGFGGRYTPEYLLGIDNRFFYTFMPMICLLATSDLAKKGTLSNKFYFSYALSLGTLIARWSVGAMVSILLIIIYLALIYKKESNINLKIFTVQNYILFIVVIFLFVIVFRSYELFEGIIVGVLQKDMTFSTRTLAWDRAFAILNKYPLLGYGIHSDEDLYSIFGNVTHPHNHFLYLLYSSGFIGFGLFIITIIQSCFSINKVKKDPVSRFLAFCLFVYLIDLCFDSADYTGGLIMVLTLCYHANMLSRDS